MAAAQRVWLCSSRSVGLSTGGATAHRRNRVEGSSHIVQSSTSRSPTMTLSTHLPHCPIRADDWKGQLLPGVADSDKQLSLCMCRPPFTKFVPLVPAPCSLPLFLNGTGD